MKRTNANKSKWSVDAIAREMQDAGVEFEKILISFGAEDETTYLFCPDHYFPRVIAWQHKRGSRPLDLVLKGVRCGCMSGYLYGSDAVKEAIMQEEALRLCRG